jgi:hypothetical protein
MADNKDIEPDELPDDEELIIDAVSALIVAGMCIYTFIDIPCHDFLLNQRFFAN